jgi:glyoxylase-like metal-dependent hydrolase (beta-lactamase superfamily II)
MDQQYLNSDKALRLFLLLGLVALSVLTTDAQEDPDSLDVVYVRGNIYMLKGPGGNIALSLGHDGTLLVDSKFANLADEIRAVIDSLHGGKIGYVLNTHFHADHISGNQALGRGVPIIAHHNVRQRLLARPSMGQRYVPQTPEPDWPTLTFDRTLSIHFNGEEIRAVHFAHGHTDGDIAVFFTGADVVHMGDLFFNRLFPFVDLDYGGDVENLARHIGQFADSLPTNTRIIPGHGPLATLDDLQIYRQMLEQTLTIVRQGIATNKSLDQIKAEGLPEEWAHWDWSFVPTRRWLEIVYWSLAAKQK